MKDMFEKMKCTLPAAILQHAKSQGIAVDDVKPQIRGLLRELNEAPIEEIAAEMWQDMDTNKVLLKGYIALRRFRTAVYLARNSWKHFSCCCEDA